MPPAEKGGSEPSLALRPVLPLTALPLGGASPAAYWIAAFSDLIDDLDGVVEEFIEWWQRAERLDRLQRFADEGELVRSER